MGICSKFVHVSGGLHSAVLSCCFSADRYASCQRLWETLSSCRMTLGDRRKLVNMIDDTLNCMILHESGDILKIVQSFLVRKGP